MLQMLHVFMLFSCLRPFAMPKAPWKESGDFKQMGRTWTRKRQERSQAIRLEAITIRLEAIAFRLEATANMLETISLEKKKIRTKPSAASSLTTRPCSCRQLCLPLWSSEARKENSSCRQIVPKCVQVCPSFCKFELQWNLQSWPKRR